MSVKGKQDRMAWFKFDAGAFISDMSGLSNIHAGIYIKLQAVYWISGNQFPDSMEHLKRRLGVNGAEEEAAFTLVLEDFFSVDATGKLCFTPLDNRLAEIQEISAKQSARARSGRSKPAEVSSGDDDQF